MDATIDQTVAELTPLLTQIVTEIKNNNISISEVSSLLSQIIDQKEKASLTNAALTVLVSEIMANQKKNSLTAPEVSNLWTQYMGDSMSICVNKYFLNIIEDKELQSIIEYALQLSQNHISKITELFNQANFQEPHGFTDQDVNINAPRLFTDGFIAFYTEIMTIQGVTAYSLALTTCEREDLRHYFIECTVTASELCNKIIQYRQNKGQFTAAPSIPSPKQVEFVEKTGVISNLIGDKRPLNASEINNLFFNTKKNTLNRALNLAFSQVAKTEDVRTIGQKNVKAAARHIEELNKILEQDGLQTPKLHDNGVTNSTVSPFSDKLMMFHIGFLESATLAFYGAGLTTSMRSDVLMTYNKILKDIQGQGRIVFDILVKHGWLEKQPEAIDRKALAQGNTKRDVKIKST